MSLITPVTEYGSLITDHSLLLHHDMRCHGHKRLGGFHERLR